MELILAVDLGGTKTAVGIVDARGRVLRRETEPTRRGSFDEAVAAIVRLSRGLLAESGGAAAVGASLPGVVDPARGLLLASPSSGWRDAPFGPALSRALGIPVRCDNDVKACALAEARFGAGRALGSFFWMTISTGVGGAFCEGGRVLRGSRGMAGEIGHLAVREGGAPCGCGRSGCLEAEAAGPAWRRKALDLMRRGGAAAGGYLAGLGTDAVDARAVAAGARAGDPLCLRVVEDVGAAFSRGVEAVSTLFDPEAIVVGGGVAGALDLLLPFARRGPAGLAPPPPVIPSDLGYDAALVGAAALALDRIGTEALDGT